MVSLRLVPIAVSHGKPNLNDVVDFLSSGDTGQQIILLSSFVCLFVVVYIHVYHRCCCLFLCTGLVANAASYLQHLAYGDDSMKAKIRFKILIKQR